MKYVRSLLARMTGLFTKDATDDDLRAEMEAHLEMEIAENVRRGMHPDEARRQAILASGGITQATEAVRDQRGLPLIESLGADVKYAFRALRHARGFSAVVVLTLALGIGANTAIFSVIRGVLLKPLPHREGDRLVYLRQSAEIPGGANLAFSVPEVTDLRAGARSLGSIAEYSDWSGILRGRGDPLRVEIGLVTGNYFEVMGLSTVIGRTTGPSDDGSGVPPVMVLTHEFWLKHYAGDPTIVGKQVDLDGNSVTVIGVLQPAPSFPDRIDAFTNMVISPHHLSAQMVQGRSHRMTEVVARLARGATLDGARAEVAGVYERLQREYKDAYNPSLHYRVEVIPFKQALGERARMTLWLLMAAAAFVMIISAANVTNLTLMRGIRRQHELVVRAALGAGIGRLRRLLLVENLMLDVAGAAVGVGIALAGIRRLASLAARYSPRANEITLDSTVLGFTLALSVGVALLLSFATWVPKNGAMGSAIGSGTRRLTASIQKHRVQRILVVAQIAVSVILLAGAGLLTRTLVQLSEVRTGLGTEEVLTMQVPLLNLSTPGAGGDQASWFRAVMQADMQAKGVYEQMRGELAALPGVTAAGVGSSTPLRSSMAAFELKAEGKAVAVGEALPRPDFRTADPHYFDATGIPLLRGRSFVNTDVFGAARVAIINQTLADQLFPGEDPIGKRVAWTGEVLKFSPISPEWRTVVGVIGNTRDGGPEAKPRGVVFMPFAQELSMSGVLIIRTDSNAARLAPAATKIVRRVVPNAPIENVMTIAQIKDERVAPRRLNAVLVSAFGVLAVIIAAVGIAGVLAFSVSARTTEIGIRMSLGADQGRVQRMILGEGGLLLVVGLVLGVAGAFFAARVIQGMLFGVAPHDPATFTGVAIVMAAIGIGACWIPARRASRIDPAITMRAG